MTLPTQSVIVQQLGKARRLFLKVDSYSFEIRE
jgi:hypothetical protein